MSEADTKRAIVAERRIAAPPNKVWRALTEPSLMGQWGMESDFLPRRGHSFTLRGQGGATTQGEVTRLEPGSLLAYRLGEAIVTWTLHPRGSGTELRVEHAGERGPEGLGGSWPRVLDRLAQTASAIPGD